ncbi:MAG TPA: hypothetical protein PK250_00645 [Syntrophobacter fumaroxidans]|nr:hypothetical protein [Syntrophobacter fumaroxidans]
MSEKQNDDAAEKKRKIDFDAFELQIDQEIDSLFIPAGQTAQDAGSSAAVGKEAQPAPARPAPVTSPKVAPEIVSGIAPEMVPKLTVEPVPETAPKPAAASLPGMAPERVSKPDVEPVPEISLETAFKEVGPAVAEKVPEIPAQTIPKVVPDLPESAEGFHRMTELQPEAAAPVAGGGELEVEIDREIDLLFQAETAPSPTPEPTAAPSRPVPDILATGKIKTEDIMEEPVFEPLKAEAPPAAPPSPLKPVEIKSGDFELQLDQEIDSLFVPSSPIPPAPSAKTPTAEFQFEIPGAEAKAEEPPVPRVAAEQPAPKAPQVDLLADLNLEEILSAEPHKPASDLFRAAPEKAEPAPAAVMPAPDWFKPVPDAPAVTSAPVPDEMWAEKAETAPAAELEAEEGTELAALLDAFKIAYLSLDWEFSVENISSLQASLSSLEPHCRKSAGANSIYKILKAVLERLKTKPHAINPQLIEMVRDSQELLKPILLKEGHLDRQEKERVKNLIARFQTQRDKTSLDKAPITSRLAAEADAGMEVDRAIPLATLPEDQIAFVDRRPISALKGWLEASRALVSETVQGLEFENRRLRQIEQILGKTKALEPLVARLEGIRANVEKHVLAFKSREPEWDERIRWLGELDVTISSRGGQVPRPAEDAVELEEVVLEAEELQEPGYAPAFSVEGDVRPGQVYYFSLGGKKFAVLASQVVKIDKVSGSKVKKFVKQGYASLNDFKPTFKNIKAGLFGTWGGLPVEVLKGYRFVPIPAEVFGSESLPARSGGAILLSSGKRHGIVFCDSAVVDLHNDVEIVIGKTSDDRMLGSIMGVADSPVEVLNLDRTVRSLG